MERLLIDAKEFSAGDGRVIDKEPDLPDLTFRVHKFTSRPRPNVKNVCIFPMFAEFGCETVAVVYCLPRLLQTKYSGKYAIAMGWKGREYFYRHLVDEFWELDDQYQFLRNFCLAFHHDSVNLRRAQKKAAVHGTVVDADEITYGTLFPRVERCPKEICGGKMLAGAECQVCDRCGFATQEPGVFIDPYEGRKRAVWLPEPSPEKMEKVKRFVPVNGVGITARARRTYGRNLPVEFYKKLVALLEDMGYRPVWIGEKVSSMPCPLPRIIDYASSSESLDLECTLALTKQLKFTIQFYTASSRLAALVGTPYVLFESPDQIYGNGQEGLRLNLCTRGNRKLVISHFRNVLENQDAGLRLAYRAVREMEDNNWKDIIGLVSNPQQIDLMRKTNAERVGCRIQQGFWRE